MIKLSLDTEINFCSEFNNSMFFTLYTSEWYESLLDIKNLTIIPII